jgi:hypothetical protein
VDEVDDLLVGVKRIVLIKEALPRSGGRHDRYIAVRTAELEVMRRRASP